MSLRASVAAVLVALTLSAAARAQPLTSPTPEAEGWFGAAVTSVPDTDGDGVADVLVGAPREDVPGADGAPLRDAGRVHLYSGATGALLYSLASPEPERFGHFGKAVAGVPDLDRDGRGDLAVGSPYAFGPTSYGPTRANATGRVYVFSGATGALLSTLLPPSDAAGIVNGSRFGWALAGLGDLDGDGRGELAVGAPYHRIGSSVTYYYPGVVYVYSAAAGDPTRSILSPQRDYYGYFGWSIAAVPDADGDGRDELAVGAPFEDAVPRSGINYDDEGRVHLVNPATGALVATLSSSAEQRLGLFGWAVAGVPDADGDGRGDVLVGAPYEEAPGAPTSAGRAELFSGATGAALQTLVSPAPQRFGLFGWAVAGVPDADGDGRGDLLVGAPIEAAGGLPDAGRVTVFSGATGAVVHALAVPAAADANAGYAVAGTPSGGAIVAAYRGQGDGNGAVWRFDAAGAVRASPPGPPPVTATPAPSRSGVCTNPVLLAPKSGTGARGLWVFSAETGALLDSDFLQDRTPSFGYAASPTPDRDGVLVTDVGYDLVWEYDCDGQFVRSSFIAVGDHTDLVGFPSTVDVSPDGARVWIAMGGGSAQAGTVVAFDAAGTMLGPVVPRGVLGSASGIVARADDLLIADAGDDTVKRFTPDGAFLDVFTPFDTPLDGPGQMVPTATGGVLVVGRNNPAGIYEFAADGAALGVVPTPEGTNGVYELPDGRLFVTTDRSVFVRPRNGPGVALADGRFGKVGAFLEPRVVADAPAAEVGALDLSVAPNPARGSARVTATLGAAGLVRVSVFDALGRRVTVLTDTRLPAGRHTLTLDARRLPAGVYLVRLDAAGASLTRPLTVSR